MNSTLSRLPSWDEWEREARRRDDADPLASFRSRFYIPADTVYLDGNSLGLFSQEAEAATLQVLADWRTGAIKGWTEATPTPWFHLAEETGARVAPLVGAEPEAVIVTGSTTLNLHQILATFYEPDRTGRDKIVGDRLNFPSDLYAIESHLRLRGRDPATRLVLVDSRDGVTLNEQDIIAALTDDVQIAVLPSVLYLSGQLLDIPAITKAAHARGVKVAWDLSHSVGAIPHELDAWGVDFAFWCHYKHMNAGPGSVGGLYVNRRHWGASSPGLAGWFGSRKERQFDLSATFAPAETPGGLQIGTPHLLSLAPLAGALTLHEEAGIARIRAKSLALTAFLRELAEAILSDWGVRVVTPYDDRPARRAPRARAPERRASFARPARPRRRAGFSPAQYPSLRAHRPVQHLRRVCSRGSSSPRSAGKSGDRNAARAFEGLVT